MPFRRRRVNSKPLTGDITLSAAYVNAFALGMTGVRHTGKMTNQSAGTESGVYNVPLEAHPLILHLPANIGSRPAVQFCVNYKNGGIFTVRHATIFGLNLTD